MEDLVHQRKSLVLILVRQRQDSFELHYNADKNVNFPTQFCLRSMSNGFRV